MKEFIVFLASIGATVGLAIPCMFGLIPPIIGVSAILIIVILTNVILMVLLRGLPMAIATIRMQGGMLWGVVKRTRNILVARIKPVGGMVPTEQHGRFTHMTSQMYNMGGVQIGFAPEKVGYNVGFDQVSLVNLLRTRGIHDITEVCNLDKYGYFAGWKGGLKSKLEERGINDIKDVCDLNEKGKITGFKDDPRIKDLNLELDKTGNVKGLEDPDSRIADLLKDDKIIRKMKEKYGQIPGVQMDLDGFSDFYRYTKEAANPYHQDANVKQGVAQALGKQKGTNTGLWVLIGLIVGVVVTLVAFKVIGGGGGGETIIRYVYENAGHVIPA